MTEYVSICEVCPRDGLQIAKTRMTTAAKVRWIEAIAAAGVQEIEVGSFVPPRVIPQPSGGGDRNAVPLYDFPSQRIVQHFIPDMPIRVSAASNPRLGVMICTQGTPPGGSAKWRA